MKKHGLACLLILGISFLSLSFFQMEEDSPQSKIISILNMSDSLYYSQIPDAPDDYSAPNVLARTVDGLGYRFYWATEGLDDKALDFDPGNDNRSPREMMDHFVILSEMVLNGISQKVNIRPRPKEEGDFIKKRELTLSNLWKASLILRQMEEGELEKCKLIFQKKDGKSELPLWNLINGPLSDAIYHTGQIVSQRRSAGNPIHPGVSVLLGKTNLNK